jgi:hypothetical protein
MMDVWRGADGPHEDARVNRWRWIALTVFFVGVAVSFLLVPYDQGDCPNAYSCGTAGHGLRMLGVLLTALMTFVLLVVGAVDRD